MSYRIKQRNKIWISLPEFITNCSSALTFKEEISQDLFIHFIFSQLKLTIQSALVVPRPPTML